MLLFPPLSLLFKISNVSSTDEEFVDDAFDILEFDRFVACAAEGAMDAGNMLKPALARGELHCVGATTLDEYRQYIEKDAALARRYQTAVVGGVKEGIQSTS